MAEDGCRNFSTQVEDEIIYGSLALHINGDYGNYLCSKAVYDEYDSSFLLQREEANLFFKNGFFILDNGISNDDLIRRAREYIDSQYFKWLKISKRQDDWRCHYRLNLLDLSSPFENAPVIKENTCF